jgi:hypothetical protein
LAGRMAILMNADVVEESARAGPSSLGGGVIVWRGTHAFFVPRWRVRSWASSSGDRVVGVGFGPLVGDWESSGHIVSSQWAWILAGRLVPRRRLGPVREAGCLSSAGVVGRSVRRRC